MRKLVLIFLSIYSANLALAQRDSVIRTGIGINGGELINIARDEPNLRISIEQRFLKYYALLLEPGIYFNGTGFNFRAEIKHYWRRTNMKRDHPDYMGFAWTFKDHSYAEPLEYYTDSSKSVVTTHKLHVEKQANTFDFILGWVRASRIFYFDGYVGLGVRFKNISGITPAQDYLIEDNVAGTFELIPGHHVLPDITAGVRLGIKTNKR